MALIQPAGVDPKLMQRVAEAEAFLKESADYYREAGRKARDIDEPAAKTRDRMHDYRKVALAALDEGRRVADEINRARGIVREYALDLAAARDEVERLLDRFAAAVGAGRVPERAE